MKVIILEDGITAKTLNPFQHPEALDPAWDMKRKRFTEAESERKVYELVECVRAIQPKNISDEMTYEKLFKPGTIHEATLLPNGKIKIKD